MKILCKIYICRRSIAATSVSVLLLSACASGYLAPGNAKLPSDRLSVSSAPDAAVLQLAAPLARADVININDPAPCERTLLGELVADYARTPVQAVAPAGLRVKPGRPVNLHLMSQVGGMACGAARTFVLEARQTYTVSPVIRQGVPIAQACDLRVVRADTLEELPPSTEPVPTDPSCRR